MKMYKYALALGVALLGLLAVPTWAADNAPAAPGQRRGQTVEAQLDQMAKTLNLTEEQKTKLKPILQKQADKARALREDTSLSREQRQEKYTAIRNEISAEVKKVLTPEQFEKWEKARQQRGTGQRNRPQQ